MIGGAELVVDRKYGPNRMAICQHRVPLHVGKAHQEGTDLIVHVVNPTAGLFAGDHARLSVTVQDGASLCLCSPGANRIHPAMDDQEAVLDQVFRVGSDSFLEYVPEALIPFAGSRYRQHTELIVESGARLIWFDWILPGRLAHGERFAFHSLRLSMNLITPEGLSLRERAEMGGGSPSVAPWRAAGESSVILTAVVYGWTPPEVQGLIQQLDATGLRAGSGALARGGVMVRAICDGPMAARQAIQRLRGGLHALRASTPPSLGAGF